MRIKRVLKDLDEEMLVINSALILVKKYHSDPKNSVICKELLYEALIHSRILNEKLELLQYSESENHV